MSADGAGMVLFYLVAYLFGNMGYYYLVLASRMYIDAPHKTDPVVLAAPLFVAILLCAAGTVVMGLYPEPWVKAALAATVGLF